MSLINPTGMIYELRNQVTKLEAELSDARADKDRLDYLQRGWAMFTCVVGTKTLHHEFVVGEPLRSELAPLDGERDLRKAIDRHRKETTGPGREKDQRSEIRDQRSAQMVEKADGKEAKSPTDQTSQTGEVER